jgi:zinc protease
VDIGRESAVATLKCLPEDLETGLDLLAEVIQHPTLPEDEIARVRERLLVSVRRANDDTRTVAARQLTETLFPESHPYRYPASGTEETLQAIERDDLIAFHQAHYGPRDGVITVVGHVNAEQVEQALKSSFAGWQGGAGRLSVALVTQPEATQTQITLAAKSQTDIALGWPLVGRDHPDYLALDLLATLFGGNGTPASSRLFRDVRERHGVSYYQYASFSGGFGPGAWTAHIGVNPAKLAFTVNVIKAELKRLCEEPIPDDELTSLKAFLADYPAVQLELPERVAVKLAEMERFGLGLDYLERYPGLIAALTPAHLQRVARRYLDLNQLTIVTVGPEPSAE